MAQASNIEWTDTTWNPITGCTKVSPGCKHCYAERMAKRLHAMGVDNYRNRFQLTLHPHVLEAPLRWRKPRNVFVNSMSDLFHPEVPMDFVRQVFGIMREASWHRFQILTKRAERLRALADDIDWPTNVWMGVSVENERYLQRVDDLRQVPANIRFLSLEPLLGPLPRLELTEIDWVIVGGESGPGARPMKREWVLDIRDQCKEDQVAFFFKQWGGVRKDLTGRELEGRTWNELPTT